MAFDRLHGWIDRLATVPGIRPWRRRRFARRFARPMGHAFFGVHDTFEAAAAAIGPGIPPSYDNAQAAGMYVDRTAIDEHDYPALFWLHAALAGGARSVRDLGGSTGIKFYAFTPVLAPARPQWHVVDVPATAALGARIARERGVDAQLTFGSDFGELSGGDVLLASGALQYLPRSLAEILDGLSDKPRRVIVNTTPIHATRSFFTLNNIGVACCPYRVTGREQFLAEVRGIGYTLRDAWRNPGKRLELPFEDGLSLDHYEGFCFER